MRFLYSSFLFTIAISFSALQAKDFESIPQLTVRGEGSVFKPADQLEMTLGVLTRGNDSDEALRQNNRRLSLVIEYLERVGLEKADYQTGRLEVKPFFKKDHEENKEISYVEAYNTIKIKSDKVDLADQIVDAAIKGGANLVGQLNANLNNPEIYRNEAIQLAVKKILFEAEALAQALDVRLVRVLDANLDQWHKPLPRMMATALETKEIPITVGRVEVQASVTVTFEIKPNK